MQWPQLVPPGACRVPIVVTLTEGNGEDGAPRVVKTLELQCSYNGKGGWTVDAQREKVRYAAAAFFPGDLAPELPHLTGWAELLGMQLAILCADRAHNPDGSVNYTKLELM